MKGFVIAGTGSGVGKTSITTGIMSLLSKRYKVQGFKVGPDFIDPMYHSAATGRPSRNLDSFLMDNDTIRNLVGYASEDADVCVIEGVRGLYEGFSGDDDLGSTAYIAKLLDLPVVLVVDSGSLTRSTAAIINGFKSFDPEVKIAGVILNKVSGPQHSDKLDVTMSTYCSDVKVVGKIKKDRENTLGQRHLGLNTIVDEDHSGVASLERLVEPLDLDILLDIAESTDSDLPTESPYVERDAQAEIAVPYDDAYCFYYRENLECLEASGFRIRKFSPIAGERLPDADAVYLGGGYPELHAAEISSNRDFIDGVRNMAQDGKPILGECGGLMSLCSGMIDKEGIRHDMIGAFGCDSVFVDKRHGPTYVIADSTPDNPLFSGTVRAHEYHYSEVTASGSETFGFDVKRGQGIVDKKDGLIFKSTIGTYMHQHALSTKDWATGFYEKLL
ncbi:MAG: hydrogenobyrinic acid a,c-diamide synthase (glutamine-hydrolyzing) [Candidatus Methanomethylophilaceae archaeon]|nr:hydrogenobyrinic acid a,c-diamide synthase (glutamine-hydrolyzing) [Candidatus Methanomethylophilaceae archaeon]